MKYTYFANNRVPVELDTEWVEEAALMIADGVSKQDVVRTIRRKVPLALHAICTFYEGRRLAANGLEWPKHHPARRNT